MDDSSLFKRSRELIRRVNDANPDIGAAQKFRILLDEKYLKPIEILEKIVDETIDKSLWEETVDKIPFENLKNLGKAIIQMKKDNEQKINDIQEDVSKAKGEMESLREKVSIIDEEKKAYVEQNQTKLEEYKKKLENGDCDYKNMSLDRLVRIRDETNGILVNLSHRNKVTKSFFICAFIVIIIAYVIVVDNIF